MASHARVDVMRSDHTYSRREVIEGLAAVPAFFLTTAGADADIARIALGRELNAASQTLDQAVSLDGSSEWPDASSTGVAVGVSLTNSGNVTSSSNGQIIEGLNVNGIITINQAGVTVRNCRLDNIFIKAPSCTIEDCAVVGGSWNSGINVLTGSATIRRCDISGADNGIWLEANGCLIVDNYFHDLHGSPDAHIDGLQIPASASSVSNNLIRHNNFDLPSRSTNSCITMKDATNIDIDNNRLNGGTYSIYFEGNTKGCHVTNNLFLERVYGYIGGTAANRQTYGGNIKGKLKQ
jgi:hypothetical protein